MPTNQLIDVNKLCKTSALEGKVQSGAAAQFGKGVAKAANVIEIKGMGGAVHSVSEEEREAFASYINSVLSSDAFLNQRLPLDPTSPTELFDKCSDGIIFAKLINLVEPDAIDERALNMKTKISKFQVIENCNLAINAAKSIGCSLVNIGASNIMEGSKQPHLVLGLAWQIIKKGLLATISLKNHPSLFRLLKDGETLPDLTKLPPEQILIRWVNFQLARAHASSAMAETSQAPTIGNFGAALKDSSVYDAVLHQLDPGRCPLLTETNTAENAMARAEGILRNVSSSKSHDHTLLTPAVMP